VRLRERGKAAADDEAIGAHQPNIPSKRNKDNGYMSRAEHIKQVLADATANKTLHAA
jgi:hypothetical protein